MDASTSWSVPHRSTLQREVSGLVVRNGTGGRKDYNPDSSLMWHFANLPYCMPIDHKDVLDDGCVSLDDGDELEEEAEESDSVTFCSSRGVAPLFDLPKLLLFLSTSLSCPLCASKGVVGKIQCSTKSFGLGTNLVVSCTSQGCPMQERLEPDKCTVEVSRREGSPTATRKTNSPYSKSLSYQLNHKMVLAMQYCGLGFSDFDAICGILGIDGRIHWDVWKAVEDHLVIVEEKLRLELEKANLQLELSMSDKDSADTPDFGITNGRSFLVGTESLGIVSDAVVANRRLHKTYKA